MKFRWAHVVLGLVLLAPVALCVGCECKEDSDCGPVNYPQFQSASGPGKGGAILVGGVLTNQVAVRQCRDKHCEP